MLQLNGIKIKKVDGSEDSVTLATNIRLLRDVVGLNCYNNGKKYVCKDEGINEAATRLAENLIQYAKGQWNMDIESVDFTRYSVKVVVRNPDCIEGSLQLLEKAMRAMCLSLIKVYDSEVTLLSSDKAYIRVGYTLLPKEEIFAKIMPNELCLIDKPKQTEIFNKISHLPGIGIVSVGDSYVRFSLGLMFADTEPAKLIQVAVWDILRHELDPNIILTEKDNPPALSQLIY